MFTEVVGDNLQKCVSPHLMKVGCERFLNIFIELPWKSII